MYVREAVDRESLVHYVIHPEETYREAIPVKVITDEAVNSVALGSSEGDIELDCKNINGYKIFTATADIADGKEYVLKINGNETDRIIGAKILDHFEFDGTKIVKFLADTETAEIPEYITEIADDAFDGFAGTIYCYPNSAAETFAKEKGVAYEAFSFTVNVSDIRMNPDEVAEIEVTASPYMPKDFTLKAEFNDAVIDYANGVITALAPGYTRLQLSSAGGMWSEEIRIYVGGGVTKGDLNADGKINSIDALTILQANVGNIILDDVKQLAADVNGDGRVNSIDALIVLQISTEKRSIWDYIK